IPTAPLNRSNDQILIWISYDLAGLERKLRNDVHIPRGSTLRGNSTERSGIKVHRPVNEVGMVQNVDCRTLQLKANSLCDLDPLGNAEVHVEVIRTREAVDREIAERTRIGSGHQAWLKCRRRRLAGCGTSLANGYVKKIRVNKEDAGRCLEESHILLEL